MSRYISIGLIIPILFLIFVNIYEYQIIVNENAEFEDYTYKRISNYAADAAVEEILFTGDLGTDYADGQIDVQPDLAVREYCNTILLGMGMPTTDYNIEVLEASNIKCMIVCAYDGFYVYANRDLMTGRMGMVSTPKIPYFYTSDDGTQYCINLGLEKGRWDSIDSGSYRVNAMDNLPSNVTVDRQLTAINQQVSDYLQFEVSNAYGGYYGRNYLLPSFASEINGAQAVQGITFIGIIDTNNASIDNPNLCMSIGGARIVDTDPILGFVKDDGSVSVKYYAPQSKLVGRIPEVCIRRQFMTEEEAAKEGYNCYLPAYQ